ncbi:uncharacterized protein MONOS_15051 [Monocercomonoides exilis]|uniref:uncharacterized protein n=1 Tax=Monocercomonoides exilis TaxID=2049356 RepID=UPI00355A3BAE|nr:hypothetical protein MONOS_15051 [Monocercomonoides exilis]|eukprot:MONOS_15051.1-p1 / transcript=MONOS_15051.1 / gene=MONOS_15051 / organism=Monocercomonoides_exilis_PA203 / gene_product=unspecified product / transcript_product=unspecified product / location=Mono_scaffold01134:5589-6044(-) / protein_length=152 / sequence_SO=supercontig / SO=protein_coding / is_pseudo=false
MGSRKSDMLVRGWREKRGEIEKERKEDQTPEEISVRLEPGKIQIERINKFNQKLSIQHDNDCSSHRRIRLVYIVRDDRVCSDDATEEREAEHSTRSYLFHALRKREWFFFLLQDYSPHRTPARPAGESSEGQRPLPSGLRDQGEKAKSVVK